MDTPIVAVHLFYGEGKFSAHTVRLPGGGRARAAALKDELLCAACARAAWHLTPEPGDADLVKSAQHLTQVSRLAEVIALLEADQLEPGGHCLSCGVALGPDDPPDPPIFWFVRYHIPHVDAVSTVVKAPDGAEQALREAAFRWGVPPLLLHPDVLLLRPASRAEANTYHEDEGEGDVGDE